MLFPLSCHSEERTLFATWESPGICHSEERTLFATWESHKVVVGRFILYLWDCHGFYRSLAMTLSTHLINP